jgi:hypothetical protein
LILFCILENAKELQWSPHYRFDLGNANLGFTLHTFDKTYIVVHREEIVWGIDTWVTSALIWILGYAIVCNTQEFQVLLNEAYLRALALFWYCSSMHGLILFRFVSVGWMRNFEGNWLRKLRLYSKNKHTMPNERIMLLCLCSSSLCETETSPLTWHFIFRL